MRFRTFLLAAALVVSIGFVGEVTGSNGNLTANAQIVDDLKRVGRASYRGGRWVTVRVDRGGKWVTKRVWQSGKWVWRGGKSVFVRSKRRL